MRFGNLGLIGMSWFDLTSSRLQQLGLWTSFLQLPLFSSWNVPSQPETFGRSWMLKKIGRCWGYWGGGCDFQSLLYVLISHCSSHYFLGCFDVLEMNNLTSSGCIRSSFLPTWEARVSFWAPWAEVPQDWEVNTIKYPRSLVYLKFGEAKMEIWLNNVEWFVFEDRAPVVVLVLVKLF